MASHVLTSRRVFARDLVSYTDAELDLYLEEHRFEGGASAIDIEDPEHLPDNFIQRLRNRAQCASNTTRSRAINLDQVTSRLLELSSAQNKAPQPSSESYNRPSSVETEPPVPTEESEREVYSELVNKGGRPFYPIHLVDDVAKDPVAHWDMLRPWLNYPPEFEPDLDSYIDWRVFKLQLGSWLDFRPWQAHYRSEGRPRYVEVDYHFGALDQAYNIFVWDFRRATPTYTEAVQNLLAQYGFTRPFYFHEDPVKQDKLTIWIEYLGYESSMHYRYDRMAREMQPGYDEAWRTLVNSNVLRKFETQEYINNIECAIRHQKEEDQALAAVKSANLAFAAVRQSHQEDINKPHGSQIPPAAHAMRMATASSKVDAAKESLKSIERRNNLVTNFSIATRNHRIAKNDAACYSMRVRWIMEQVPLMEAELNESSTSPDTVRGTKRPRRDETNEHVIPTTKKQRRDAGEPASPSALQATCGPKKERLKRSHDNITHDEPPIKRVRKGAPSPGPYNEKLRSTNAKLAGD